MLRRLLKALILEPPVDDDFDEISRFLIPENSRLLTPPGAYSPTYPRSKSVKSYEGRYVYMRRIDGHPDLHYYLWDEAGAAIPRDCCWVIRAMAAFAHPETTSPYSAWATAAQ